MEPYKVEFAQTVRKDLRKIQKRDVTRILSAIDQLSVNPRTLDSKKLKGEELWRVRVGRYRVLYEIHDDILLVAVVKVGHRKEVYRKKA